MAQIQITVCDLDQSEVGKETTHYTITRDGEKMELDLCKDHGAPIESLVWKLESRPVPVKRAVKPRVHTAKKAAPRRRAGAKVVSLEEIEAMKAQQS